MNKRYVCGIIGSGMIAEVHMDKLLKTGRTRLKWIAARDPEKLERIRAKYGVEQASTDYHDMLRDEEVEVVVITTPPSLHLQMFKEAIEAGKHVLLEKPMAMDRQEVARVLETARAHPLQVALECSGRHARLIPKFRMAKALIDSGRLGEIYHVHHNCVNRQGRPGIEYHPTAKWFLDRSISGGGPLFDWGVYDMSFHLGLLGDKPLLEKVDRVVLKSRLDDTDPGTDIYDVEEHFMVQMQLSGGISYHWERAGHANMEVPNETRIYGTRGGIRLAFNSWDPVEIDFFDLDDEGKARKQVLVPDYKGHDDAYAFAEHFIAVLDGREQPAIDLETAAKHMDIIFSCYEAAKAPEI